MSARKLAYRFQDNVLAAEFIAPVVKAHRDLRTLEMHTVLTRLTRDVDAQETMSHPYWSDFESNVIQLTPMAWQQYRDFVVPGLEAVDAATNARIEQQYELQVAPEQTPFTRASLWLLGRHDATVGYQDQLSVAREWYPAATAAVLADAGHMPFIESPRLTAALMTDWLERCVS